MPLLGSGSSPVSYGTHNVHMHKLVNVSYGVESADVVTFGQMQDSFDEKLSDVTKVVISDGDTSSTVSSLVINNVTKAEYDAMLSSGTLCSD